MVENRFFRMQREVLGVDLEPKADPEQTKAIPARARPLIELLALNWREPVPRLRLVDVWPKGTVVEPATYEQRGALRPPTLVASMPR